MTMDKATVAHMAKLARLKLTEAEQDRFAGELSGILDWVEQLGEVDTAGVEPMTSGLGMALRQRPDQVTDGHVHDKVLANAPDRLDRFYSVPKVVE